MGELAEVGDTVMVNFDRGYLFNGVVLHVTEKGWLHKGHFFGEDDRGVQYEVDSQEWVFVKKGKKVFMDENKDLYDAG